MGKHRATKRRMKQHPNGHGSRPRFEKTMEGVSDECILAMAKRIGDNTKLTDLAVHLGLEIVDANNYVAMNRMNGVVSSEGTRKMLCSWRESTPAIDQWDTLEAALIKADLAGLADEFSSMAEGKARNVPSFPMEIRSKPVSGSTDHVVYPEGLSFSSLFSVSDDDVQAYVQAFRQVRPFLRQEAFQAFRQQRQQRLNQELQRRYTDPARFAEDIVLRNQGFLPQLKRRDSSSAPFYAMENSRHDILKSQMRRITVSGSNTAELTALCYGISYDWATQNGATALSEIQHLLELSANDIKPNQTIEKAIKDQLFRDLDDVDEALIRQLLNERPDEFTILLNGANESNCGDNIMDVLTGRTLQRVTVMVTTKPRFAKRLHLDTPGGYDRIYMD